MRERLFYPPNSLTGSHHWAVRILAINGKWRTYTEHETKAAAVAQCSRMISRWPSHQLMIAEVTA